MGQINLRKRLTKCRQGVKPHLQIAVKEGRTGAEALFLRDQPEMANAGWHQIAICQIGEQRVIACASLFGSKHKAGFAQPCVGVAGNHVHDPVSRVFKPAGKRCGNSGVILKEQPGFRVAVQIILDINIAACKGRPPGWAISPVADVLVAGGGAIGLFRCLFLGRFDEIMAALKGVGGKGQAVATCIAPNLIPIRLVTAGPQTADHTKEVGIIRDVLFRVAQGGQHLSRLYLWRHLSQ